MMDANSTIVLGRSASTSQKPNGACSVHADRRTGQDQNDSAETNDIRSSAATSRM